jgi:hypothetical protein
MHLDKRMGIDSLVPNFYIINTNILNTFTLSLRATNGSVAISPRTSRLLRRFTPRNGTSLNTFVLMQTQ